jgi:hypothetical protein
VRCNSTAAEAPASRLFVFDKLLRVSDWTRGNKRGAIRSVCPALLLSQPALPVMLLLRIPQNTCTELGGCMIPWGMLGCKGVRRPCRTPSHMFCLGCVRMGCFPAHMCEWTHLNWAGRAMAMLLAHCLYALHPCIPTTQLYGKVDFSNLRSGGWF